MVGSFGLVSGHVPGTVRRIEGADNAAAGRETVVLPTPHRHH
jgi:hypothetical protein